MQRYNPKDIEPKWQQVWADSKIYQVTEDASKPKSYVTAMFPYPSGSGLHVGHVRNYSITDTIARFQRQNGKNVLTTIGWDGFGLPAENYAIKTGTPPAVSTAQNIANFKNQLSRLGMSYDWSREINTTDPSYYRWTQWIFTKLFERGLAYQAERMQWWCPVDKTVLANEQVESGKCWRCGNEVIKKSLNQWFFKITDYADQLLEGVDDLQWPEKIKTMQRNWIGRSEGAEVEFEVCHSGLDSESKKVVTKDTLKFTPELTGLIQSGKKQSTVRLEAKKLQTGDYVKLQTRFSASEVRSFAVAKITNVQTQKLKDVQLDVEGDGIAQTDEQKLAEYQKYYGDKITADTEFTVYDFEVANDILTVFTTRADTLFGATFLVLAPEHPLIKAMTTDDQRKVVEEYTTKAIKKSELERQESKQKTGVFTGAYAINPVNDKQIPIWTADYVLWGYGTGAIMAVPAHDERDYEFAKTYNLPIVPVIAEQFIDKRDDVNVAKVSDRRVAVAVVHNPKNDKYCLIHWNKNHERNGLEWPGGGLDKDETIIEGALREFKEETGYSDVSVVEILPAAVTYYYVSPFDGEHRRAVKYIVKLELNSEENTGVEGTEDYEKGNYQVEWLTKNEILTRLPERSSILVAITDRVFNEPVYSGEGVLIDSGDYNNLTTSDAREKIVADLEKKQLGTEVTNYKMRDWLISRQRYWGAPIPIIHCEKDGAVAVPEDQLPVILPEVASFEPTGDGRGVLGQNEEWLHTTCPKCGGPALRETDTMDGYACSSWYFLRYTDANNDQQAWDPTKANYWLPIDYYCGGDHAVSHLLYSRFWMHVFADMGLIAASHKEPVRNLVYNGYIYASDGTKMSKSKGNVVDPLEVIDNGYGADALRVYELFIAPYDQNTAWDNGGVAGSYRFLNRVWTLTQEFLSHPEQSEGSRDSSPIAQNDILRAIHRTIKKVSEDLNQLSFNTAIAAQMENVNELYLIKAKDNFQSKDWHWAIETLLQLLAPFAPHIAEELWQQLGHDSSVHTSTWPIHDDKYLLQDVMTIAIQVNGKLRGEITVSADADEATVVAAAKINDKVQSYIEGHELRRTIYVPGKLVSFVV